ncbi:MAG: helix-turn-helix transcriptional regulator [Roseiarcus sp.]|jgi:transcriptional regulator with XRE-family HTH domain
MKKVPNPIDSHVGARLRMRRMLVGMSQERLGAALGITFQQIQKYEKGANRIGASRLQDIARVLQVAPAFFFDGAPSGDAPAAAGFAEPGPTDFFSSSEGVQLATAFSQIRDPKVRRRVLALVVSLAQDSSGSAAEALLDSPRD